MEKFKFSEPHRLTNYIGKQEKRFAWQDLWCFLSLIFTLDPKDKTLSLMLNNIQETYIGGNNLVSNEPLVNKKASWGGDLARFTGDTALYYLCLKLLYQKGHPEGSEAFKNFLSVFDKFLQVL